MPFVACSFKVTKIRNTVAPGAARYFAATGCFVYFVEVMLLRGVHPMVLGFFSAATALACAAAEIATVVIDGAGGGQKSVSTTVGTTLTIDLIAVPGTGFRWITSEPLPSIISFKGDETISQETRPGQKGRQRLTFVVVGAGQGRIVLHYRRSWEPVTGKEDSFELKVIAQ